MLVASKRLHLIIQLQPLQEILNISVSVIQNQCLFATKIRNLEGFSRYLENSGEVLIISGNKLRQFYVIFVEKPTCTCVDLQ